MARFTHNHKIDPLLEAVIQGKCIYFEGEEAPKETQQPSEDDDSEDQTTDSNEQDDQAPPTEDDQEEQPSQDEQPEPALKVPNDEMPSPENVNSDQNATGSKRVTNPNELATMFLKSGALQKVLSYVLNKFRGGQGIKTEAANPNNQITVKQIRPFIRAGMEHFVQQNKIEANPAVIQAAAVIAANNTGSKTIHEKEAEAKKKAAEAKQQSGNADGASADGGMPMDTETSAPTEGGADGGIPEGGDSPSMEEGGSSTPAEAPTEQPDEAPDEPPPTEE